ncbi:MAG: hypothetical protein IJY62_03355 [Clostridia bacterium]|nr:hypothetical protein [Clostridia bacterium]
MKRSLVLSLLFTAIGAATLLGNTGGAGASCDGAACGSCIDNCVYSCEAQNCSTDSCNVNNCQQNCSIDCGDCLSSCVESCLAYCTSQECADTCGRFCTEFCSQTCSSAGNSSENNASGGVSCSGPTVASERDLVENEDYSDLALTFIRSYQEGSRHYVEFSFSVNMLRSFSELKLIIDIYDAEGNRQGVRTLEKTNDVNYFSGSTYGIAIGLSVPYEDSFYYQIRFFRGVPQN